MNCRRVEELIPLYVEDDLKADESRQIAAHLDGCESCRASFEEMSDSQKWIQSFSGPDFDEAFFDHLRSGVLRSIEMKERPPSFFSLLTERLLQRPALAATVALLIIVAAATLYIYSGRTKNESVEDGGIAREYQNEERQEEKKPDPDRKERKKPRPRRDRRPRPSNVMIATSQDAIEPEKEIAIEPDRVPENVDEFPALEAGSQKRDLTPENVMRIEFQTADPNIRIIWFAPKETEIKQTRPVTD